MKNNITYALLLGALFANGESAASTAEGGDQSGADYSSLLRNYECDMDSAEVARAMGVSESRIAVPGYAKESGFAETGKCYFTVEDFGEDADGADTQINWGSEDGMSLADVKNEIESYSKNTKDMPASVRKITGLDLQVADTNDSYLAYQNKTGRIMILNEHYGAMLLTYGTVTAGSSRTQKQQEELKVKMTQLANFLLEQHTR